MLTTNFLLITAVALVTHFIIEFDLASEPPSFRYCLRFRSSTGRTSLWEGEERGGIRGDGVSIWDTLVKSYGQSNVKELYAYYPADLVASGSVLLNVVDTDSTINSSN
jgi:hypothetical protein